jgi:hypothetical protein
LNNKKKPELKGAFTACTAVTSLLKTVTDAAEIVARMAAMMLSTARSSFDEFQNARNSGQNLYILVKSISWGRAAANPNISGEMPPIWNLTTMHFGNCQFSFRAFLREKHEANHSIINPQSRKDANPRQINE